MGTEPESLGQAVARTGVERTHQQTTTTFKAAKRDLMFAEHKIPVRYRKADYSGFDDKGVSKARLAVKEGHDCILLGVPGAGKTQLATAMMIDHLMRQYEASETGNVPTSHWAMVPMVLHDLRATFGTKISSDVITKPLREANLLLLDDLGAEQDSDWSATELYIIIADRINNCRQTIVTTNLSGEEIEAWNKRIYSRLASFDRIVPGTVDRRKEAKT